MAKKIKISRFFENKKVTLVTACVGVALIAVGMVLRCVLNAGAFDNAYTDASFLGKLYRLGSEEALTLYLSQLSFTFITISVMSVLSDSSVVIYWENIVKKKLIEPVWKCFYSYTTYSFATVIFGGIAALMGLPLVFLAFFIIDIIVLMALTFSMIDVYFRHDEKAARLEREFGELVSYKEAPEDEIKQDYEKYLKITSKLRTNTIVALKEHDSPTLEENFRFYARNAAYIPKRDFETIMKCVDEINIFDFTEWFDYYAQISYKNILDNGGVLPKVQSQFYIENVMCKNSDLFYFVFDPHILPLFAEVSDVVSAESIFCDYKFFMKKQRDAVKKALGEHYDRKRNGPASSYTRSALLRCLLEVMKKGNQDFVMSFLHSFEETNMLTNYDYDEYDETIWEEYFKTIPEEEASDRLNEIYPITEILYGTEYPECVKEAVRFVWGDFDELVSGGFQKDDESFSKYEAYDVDEVNLDAGDYDENCELVDLDDDLEDEIDVIKGVDSDGQEDDLEEESAGFADDESDDLEEVPEDDWEYYCKVYGQEYIGWPPENDHYGFFTYAGREVYAISYEHGELNDGDLPR